MEEIITSPSFYTGNAEGEEIDQQTVISCYNFTLNGSAGKLAKQIVASLDRSAQQVQLLKCHVGSEVIESVNLPNPSITSTANHILPYFGSQLVVRNPTLLAVAILHDQDSVTNELVKLAVSLQPNCSSTSSSLLDVGNDVCEVNVRKEIEWRATAVTPLMIACMLDKFKLAERLLDAGSDPNAQNSLGRTPLHETCFQGNVTTTQMCISRGSKVNMADNDGVTPLMLSCARGIIDLMKLLLSKGADTRQRDFLGRNALFFTLPTASVDTARQFIKADRNCYCRDNDGYGLFLAACKMERLDMVQFLVDEADSLCLRYGNTPTDSIINERGSTGRNGLHLAAEICSKQLYNLLIASGIACESDDEGRSPLMSACLTGNLDFVEFLVEQNPGCVTDLLHRDKKGRNAIFYGVTSGNVAIIAYLIEHGVPLEPTPNGLTALMQASGKGKTAVVKFLLENRETFGIDVNAHDDDKWNAAHYAASISDLASLEELVDAGIELRLTADGRTVLMESAFHGSVDMAGYLIEVMRRRNPDAPGFDHCDVEGWNAAMYALVAPNVDATIQLLHLFKTAADVKPVITKKGVTALMEVALKGSVVVTNHLLENFQEYSLDLHAVDHEGANALSYAALGGSISVFNALFERGVLCVADSTGRTVLMLAAIRNHSDLVGVLIKNAGKLGFDVFACDKKGRNALFYGCDCGSQVVAQLLIDGGVPIISDNNGVTLLMTAAETGHLNFFDWLLSKYSDRFSLNETDSEGRNVLFYALKSSSIELVEKLVDLPGLTGKLDKIPPESSPLVCKLVHHLLQKPNAENTEKLQRFLDKFSSPSVPINAADENGQSPLYYLVAENRLDAFERYVQFYDPTAAMVSRHGVTLLMHACSSSLVDVARLLLSPSKISLNYRRMLLRAKDSQGRTALTYATVSHNATIVTLLLENDARLTVDKNGHSAVTYAVQSRNLQLSLMLLNSAQDIPPEIGKVRDVEGNLLLHYGARHGGSDELVRLVLQRTGADVNARTASGGKTALMLAVVSNNVPVTRALIKAGCSVTACDADGKTALHLLLEAASKATDSMVSRRRIRQRRYLLLTLMQHLLSTPAAASLMAETDRSGKTALMLACAGGQVEATFLLLERGAQLDVKDVDGNNAIDHCFKLENCKSERDVKILPALGQFLALVRKPSPSAELVLEKFKEDIFTALTLDDDNGEEEDEEVSEKLTPIDLLNLSQKLRPFSSNTAAKSKRSYLYDDVAFRNVCSTLDANDFRELGATLRSEYYKTSFANEYFV